MSSSELPHRIENATDSHVTSMPLASPPIDEAELKLLTPPPPTHNRVKPFPVPTPGFIENMMDQEQPPDSYFGVPTWKVFPEIYNIKRHGPVHISAIPRPYVNQFFPAPYFVDLLVGHAIDSILPITAAGVLGTLPGVYLRRNAPLITRVKTGLLTGFLSASLFFPVFRFTQYRLRVAAIKEEDKRPGARPSIPMSARRSWIGMDEEGNVKQTFGYTENNPYQRWEQQRWIGRQRDIWETIYTKIDEEKLKNALEKQRARDAAAEKKIVNNDSHH